MYHVILLLVRNWKLAVISFYRSPSTKYGVVLDDFCQVLSKHVNAMWSFFYGIIYPIAMPMFL